MTVDLGALRFDAGGALLVRRALLALRPGEDLHVRGVDPDLATHLRALARSLACSFRVDTDGVTLGCPAYPDGRRAGARRIPLEVAEVAEPAWGLAARGTLVEGGASAFTFALATRTAAWTAEAGRLYAQAAAAQWDPATAIPWAASSLPAAVEEAVVQVMAYLVENETAALLVPARFCAQVHPHFREVMQLLAIQAADEARHIEVFTRRANLDVRQDHPPLSTAGGQASLKTLVDEPDFALAAFLLSVLGEGSFLSLLRFLDRYAPDPVTRAVARLAAQDEARHVAFGLAHLEHHAAAEPALLGRLAAAVHSRHDALAHTAGLNAEVFDALVVIAGYTPGEDPWAPAAIARGYARVVELVAEMDAGRQVRLRRLGFSELDAVALSALHTRNFM